MSSAPLPEGWKTVRLVIRGRVQGVSYRWWTVGEATQRGLDGWVRNRRDGSVEILASGPDVALEEMIRRCREGPAAARVERVEVEESGETVPPGFEQRPTA